jgi:hypothetical protein
VHSKRGKVRKHTTQKVRARRRTEKEVRLENALPKVVEGSKAHLKRGRVRKHTTHEVRAQRRSQTEVWLENTLPGR